MSSRDFALIPFPGDAVHSGMKITGNIDLHAGILAIAYCISGPLSEIRIPEIADPPERRDRLWEDTCLELFLAPGNSGQYWEFNLAPSCHWNVYRFSSYRKGMQEENELPVLPVQVKRGAETILLSLRVELNRITRTDESFDIGVSAVLKKTDGELTYWALGHPGPRPDFHRREGFIIKA